MEQLSGKIKLAASPDVAETPQELLESFRRVSDLLAKASTLLYKHGYECLPDGTFQRKNKLAASPDVAETPTPDPKPFFETIRDLRPSDAKAYLEALGYSVEWDITSYHFRDAVRAENDSAKQRLVDEVDSALSDLGDRLSLDGDSLDGSDIFANLMEQISDQAEEDAKLKAEEEEDEEDEEATIEYLPRIADTAAAKARIGEALHLKFVQRLAVDRYGELEGWRLLKEEMDEGDIERMQDALLGHEPNFDVCWVRQGELTTAYDEPMSLDDLPKAIAGAKAERIRFYTEREKEFGPSAWPGGSRPADLKIVSGGTA